MIAVISPSKTFNFEDKPSIQKHTQPMFLKESLQLVERLKTMSAEAISKQMGISKALSLLNQERWKNWKLPFTLQNAKPCILAFQGDVYKNLQAPTFTKSDLDFSQRHLRILSGLYGVLRPLDLIQPYRLEMGVSFNYRGVKNLYSFWKDKLSKQLMQDASLEDNVLINLASNEYFKAIQTNALSARIVTPIFKDEKNGQSKTIGVYAKKARGLMGQFIIKNRIQNPEFLKCFTAEGYHYNKSISKNNHWVFTRKHLS